MADGIAASVLFLVGAVIMVVVFMQYELTPTRQVIGKVVGFWEVPAWRHWQYIVEVEQDGRRLRFSCANTEYCKLQVGQTVRLHVKGTYAEYIRPLA